MIYWLVLSLSLTLPLIYAQRNPDSNTIYNVRIDMAENLPDEDPDAPKIFGWQAWTNKNDPYVQIYAYGTGGDDALTVKETTIKEGTETPQWDETFQFNNGDTNGPYTKFLFKIYDDDSLFDDDFLGETREVLVSEIGNCVDNNVFRLPVSRSGKECGLLVVEITEDGCTGSGAVRGYEETDTYGKNKDCKVGDIIYENGDSIGIIGYTCESDVRYSGTESYCKNGKVKERYYSGDCEDEYSGSKCCQEGEPDSYGGAVCIRRECVPWNQCINAGGIQFCEVYTPDGCNTCTCEGACTRMGCSGDMNTGKACKECEHGYDLFDGRCEWSGNSGDCRNAGGIQFCESYTPDGCNTCSCGGACTLMACEGDMNTGKACLVCEDGYELSDNGQTCECVDAGGIEFCQVYTPDGCNTCQCGGACTLMACEGDMNTGKACLECEDGYDLSNDGQSCVWNGNTGDNCINAGGIQFCQVYTPDGCNTCTCQGACTRMACPGDMNTGKACKECKDGFYLSGDGQTCECLNAGGIPFCEVYTPDGCNTCTCEGACTLMACPNDTGKACKECEVGYILSNDGQKCECGKFPGDNCETDEECCDYYCREIGGRKQCSLE